MDGDWLTGLEVVDSTSRSFDFDQIDDWCGIDVSRSEYSRFFLFIGVNIVVNVVFRVMGIWFAWTGCFAETITGFPFDLVWIEVVTSWRAFLGSLVRRYVWLGVVVELFSRS